MAFEVCWFIVGADTSKAMNLCGIAPFVVIEFALEGFFSYPNSGDAHAATARNRDRLRIVELRR